MPAARIPIVGIRVPSVPYRSPSDPIDQIFRGFVIGSLSHERPSPRGSRCHFRPAGKGVEQEEFGRSRGTLNIGWLQGKLGT